MDTTLFTGRKIVIVSGRFKGRYATVVAVIRSELVIFFGNEITPSIILASQANLA